MKLKGLLSLRKTWLMFLVVGLVGIPVLMTPSTSANHPVLVEGNCDSPVPGTTIVTVNTCGDYDGDGRIGTAEDTDGADRIFGTIGAAIGAGTGAAAGTGANFNGRIIIVKSGRFAEALVFAIPNGHLQIEAAPGVEANIDAVFQGDPGGGNNARQEAVGIDMSLASGLSVTLRNLTIRNWAIGIRQNGLGRLYIENCRIENNRDFGIQAMSESRLVIERSTINGTGRRIGTANNATVFGHGIQYQDLAAGVINKSVIANSRGAGVNCISGRATVVIETVFADNDGGVAIGTRPLIFTTY